MVGTWALEGLLHHDFGAYVYTIVVLGPFGIDRKPSMEPASMACQTGEVHIMYAVSLEGLSCDEIYAMRRGKMYVLHRGHCTGRPLSRGDQAATQEAHRFGVPVGQWGHVVRRMPMCARSLERSTNSWWVGVLWAPRVQSRSYRWTSYEPHNSILRESPQDSRIRVL